MAITDYIIRRILILIPTFFLISVLVFTLIHLAPGDPIDIVVGEAGFYVTEEQKDLWRHQLGLDKPIHEQYFIWITKFLKGDLGRSIIRQEPVGPAVFKALINTLQLTFVSEIITIVIAVILGVISAVKQYSLLDYIATTLSTLGWSMPLFWFGLLLIFFFTINMGWLPSSGKMTLGASMTPFESLIDRIKHMIMPVMAISIAYVAYLFRLVRSSMLEVLRQDYIIAARAKGLKERVVIYKHALKNALLPVVTSIGMDIRFIMGGSVLTETIFAWPGLGRYAVFVAHFRDFNALMGVTMTFAAVILTANLITDVAYSLLDPRIKY